MRKPQEFAKHFFRLDLMHFRGVVAHVVDGDTIDVFVDLGFNSYQYVTVRLKDVNTPELVGVPVEIAERGRAAKAFVAQEVLGKQVSMVTFKDRTTFGRYVADVFYEVNGEAVSLTERIKAAGHAL